MKIIRNLDALPPVSGSVVTIGNFDGLHIGHRRILDTLLVHSRRLDLPAVAITFEPHPLKRIAPSRAPDPISTSGQRTRLIEESGIDILVIQDFDTAFSHLTPDDFITRYLVEALSARLLCVGHNFRFGYQHRGTVATLQAVSPGFHVIEVPQVSRGGQMVSSSRIRQCIRQGDVSVARRLLGRCFEIEGEVVSGTGRGHRDTVPTINMQAHNELLPYNGVYCTRVRLPDSSTSRCPWIDAITNIGTRPTFEGDSITIETFVLDRTPDVRTGKIALRFLRRLRDERRFEHADALRGQIQQDADTARHFFRRLEATATPDGVTVCGRDDSHVG